MTSIVFDAGPVISLAMNNLLWILEPLQKSYRGDFYITDMVREELVVKPLKIKRFEFEALQVQGEIDCKVIKVFNDPKIQQLTNELMELANNVYFAKGTALKIVHPGEISTLAAAISLGSDCAVVDERTTRELIERPARISRTMQHRLNTKISINNDSLSKLRQKIRDIKIIRSVELISIAFEMGLLERYIEKCSSPTSEIREVLLDGVLWGAKLRGCAVSEKEIEQIKKIMLS